MSVNLNLEIPGVHDQFSLVAERLQTAFGGVSTERKQAAVRPSLRWMMSAGLFCASAALVHLLQRELPGTDPQVLLMLAPVLETGARHGRGAAMGVWCASAALSLFTLLPHASGSFYFSDANNALSFSLLIGAGPILASLAGRWRESRRDLETSERRRASFSQEVLLAATAGRLRLCASDELRAAAVGPAFVQYPLRSLDDLGLVRSRVRAALDSRNADCVRIDDLLMCVTEAATNAVKHGGGGTLSIGVCGGKVTALISDCGAGIAPANLARATLEAGFSTQGTLGMGFTLMLAMCDTLMLATSPQGTEVLIEIESPGTS